MSLDSALGWQPTKPLQAGEERILRPARQSISFEIDMIRRLFIFFFTLVLAAVLLTRAMALAAPRQPIAYNHQTHVQAGVQCLFCHSSALSADIAGIPSVQKCMGCHATIATDNQEVQVLHSYWEQGKPIAWVRVNQQPDFVYFSHQAHLLSGINCETCHGDVGRMEVARPAVNMDMGWCLDCHWKQPQDKVARLADCLACHK
jgi:Cytochrome c7 and related cytochrome c/Class III cytochrome C family